MDEETRKVLEMVARGRITAEEAERLLETLERSRKPAEAALRPEVRNVRGRTVGAPEEQVVEAADVSRLVVEGEGGRLVVRGMEGPSVKVKGRAEVERNGDTLYVRAYYHNISVEVPGTISYIRASEDGGSVKVEDVRAEVDASSDGGNVSLKHISGGNIKVSADGGNASLSDISGGSVSVHADGGRIHLSDVRASEIGAYADGGNAVLDLGGIREGSVRIEVTGGRAELIFSEDAAFELLADVGLVTEFHSELTLEILERSLDHIHARFNGGGAVIKLEAEASVVKIRSR